VAEVELLTFRQDVPVGPGSAVASPSGAPDESIAIDGGRVRYQLLDEGARYDRLEPRRRYPDADLVRVRRATAWVTDVPAYGLATLPIVAGESPSPQGAVHAGGKGIGTPWIENETLRVSREADGSFSLSERDGARRLACFIAFEDIGDAGDTYTPSLVGPIVQAQTAAHSDLLHAGPLRGEIGAHYTLTIPATSGRAGRSDQTVTLVVHVSFTLDAGAPFVRIRLSGVNVARDHRLRVVFVTEVARGDVWADAAFGPVRRSPPTVPPDDTLDEQPLPTAPLHRYVTVANESTGATLFSDGITEYEALPDGRVALTLFRGVGELSRSDLPERPGHAGWPVETPEAQCLGPFDAEVALMLHGARTDEAVDRIERCADDALVPLVGETVRALLAHPDSRHGIALDGAGLAFAACKRSEDGEWLVLRCVNLLDRPTEGSWRTAGAIAEAHLSRLDETVGDPLSVDGERVRFVAGPRAVVTVLVR
jgi:hypothetical protein